MTIKSSGALSLSEIRDEYGLSGQVSLSQFYKGGANVSSIPPPNAGVPASGAISFGHMYGTTKKAAAGSQTFINTSAASSWTVPAGVFLINVEAIGGGGGGGSFRGDQGTAGGAYGQSGGTSSVTGSGISVSASGGGGGYSYGGAGGAFPGGAGAADGGAGAVVNRTGLAVTPGQVLTINVGAGGMGAEGGRWAAGASVCGGGGTNGGSGEYGCCWAYWVGGGGGGAGRVVISWS